MSQIPSSSSSLATKTIGTPVTAGGGSASGGSVVNDIKLDDFLKLMITELQNQDPLNPMDNSQMIDQLGQIKAIGANEKLSQTLDSVLLGQNISSATSLIGADIQGLSDDNQKVEGVVQRISVSNGQPKLHLDLNPTALASAEDGKMEAGDYQYRVVWEDGGKLVGVDPLDGGSITVAGTKGEDQAVLISNLPETTASKQVYRREGTTGNFRLAGTINDPKAATFLDTQSNEELSNTVFTGAAIQVNPKRTFDVSLNNISDIRPPATPSSSP